MGTIRIGLSGWSYDEWRGEVYPDDIAREDMLAHVSRQVDTIEVNASFRRLLAPDTVRGWYEDVPADHRMAVKGSRFITHDKKLADLGPALANFFAAGVLELREKLGPVLWQVPAQLHFDAERVEQFLQRLPHDTDEAADLAREHDDNVPEPSFGGEDNHRVRHALEVRHDSWLCDEMVRLAREHNVALVIADSSQEWPLVEELTAGFVYVRLHGPDELYASGYDDGRLAEWADRLVAWRDGGEPDDARRITDRTPPDRVGRDVYVYCNNDKGGHAPRDAARLRELVADH